MRDPRNDVGRTPSAIVPISFTTNQLAISFVFFAQLRGILCGLRVKFFSRKPACRQSLTQSNADRLMFISLSIYPAYALRATSGKARLRSLSFGGQAINQLHSRCFGIHNSTTPQLHNSSTPQLHN